MTTLFNKFDLI